MPRSRLSLSFLFALAALVLSLPRTDLAQAIEGKAKPAGTISGRVTVNDKGLADIMVAAQPSDRPPQQLAIRAKTDSSGRYRLASLPAGQYQITAIAPAMAIAEQNSFGGSSFGPGKAVVLAVGEDIDEVDIKLVRGGVITGRVTDSDGKPVVEQRVNFQMIDQSGNPARLDSFMWNYQMNQTDDRGTYRIYGLPGGRYRVSVGSSESGFISSSNHAYYRLTFYGDTNDPAKATIVELQEGSEATNIDIHVGRAGNTFIAAGRLVDSENGQPIPGLRLMYGPARPNQPFYGGFNGLPTGPRGEFRLEGLEPGRYAVSVSASFEASSFYSDPLSFEITDADVTNLELRATRGVILSGVVVFEGSRAKDLQQQVATLRVLADVTSPSNPQNRTSSSSSIAANGSFQVTGVRPGKARLFVAAVSNPDLWGVTTLRVERGGVDATQNLEIQPGESIPDLRMVVSLGTGAIRGTVRFVGAAAPAGLRLYVSTKREGASSGGGALVDARGRFVIGNLTAGTYEIILNVGFIGPPAGPQIKPQTQTVTVSDNAETEIDFIVDLTPREDGP